jgi:hypothetical protein
MKDSGQRPDFVQLAISEGTPLPGVLASITGDKVRLKTTRLESQRTVPMLEIAGGEAHFASGGSVILKIPRWQHFRTCFSDYRAVLMIRDSRGTMTWNYFCCKYCGKNTGRMEEYAPGSTTGKINARFVCPHCGCIWRYTNIDIGP